jgi:O-antigen/teichoic acid export membrane protein
MDQRLTRYSKFNLAGFVISTVAGFIGGIVVARLVGGEGVGIIAAAWALIELAKPWGTLSVLPAIRRSYEVDDPDRAFGTSLAMHLVAMVPAAALLVVLSPQLAEVLNSTVSVIVISASVLIAFIPASVGIAVLDSRKDFKGRNIIVVVTNVSYLAFLLVFAVPAGTVESVAAANVLSSVLASALCLRYLSKPRLDRGLLRYFTGFGARTVVVLFSNQVVFWLGTGLATAYLGAQEGGVYRVAAALGYYAFLLPEYVVATWTFPEASSEFAKRRDLRGLFRQSTMAAAALSGMILVALLVLGRFVLGIYGEEFEEGYRTMVHLAAGFAIYALAIPAISILLTMDRPQRVMEVALTRSAIFLVVSIALLPSLGVKGIVVGVVASSIVAALTLISQAWGAMARANGTEGA